MKSTRSKLSSILHGDLTMEQLLDELDFSEEEVEHAARTLPKVWLEAAKHRVKAMQMRMAASGAVDVAKVNSATAFRSGHEVKITEKMVGEHVGSAAEVQEAERKHRSTMQYEELTKLVLEGLRLKKNAIQVVADMSRGDGAMERAADKLTAISSLDASKRKVRERYRSSNSD